MEELFNYLWIKNHKLILTKNELRVNGWGKYFAFKIDLKLKFKKLRLFLFIYLYNWYKLQNKTHMRFAGKKILLIIIKYFFAKSIYRHAFIVIYTLSSI